MSKTTTKVKPTNTQTETPTNQFNIKQRGRLLDIKDHLLDTMVGVGRDHLRSRPENSEASATGMHMADAGSDAYDRDFALATVSRHTNAIYEVEAALDRISKGTYGTCEMCGKPIPRARLEAIPFTRLSVDCQAAEEKAGRTPGRRTVTSLFIHNPEEEEEEEDMQEA